MKRVILVLLLGLAGGLGGHYALLHRLQPKNVSALDAQLAWIQRDLQLTPEQYARIRAIHEQSSAHLLALAGQVARMRSEFAAFEHQRKTVGEIDFLEFAHFVEERRMIDRECLKSTQRLVDASAGVMNPQQRARYLSLLPISHRSTLVTPN